MALSACCCRLGNYASWVYSQSENGVSSLDSARYHLLLCQSHDEVCCWDYAESVWNKGGHPSGDIRERQQSDRYFLLPWNDWCPGDAVPAVGGIQEGLLHGHSSSLY